jgi:hypothetical protein
VRDGYTSVSDLGRRPRQARAIENQRPAFAGLLTIELVGFEPAAAGCDFGERLVARVPMNPALAVMSTSTSITTVMSSLDCWGGEFAIMAWRFRVPANAFNVSKRVVGEVMCCSPGEVAAVGRRTRPGSIWWQPA